MFDILHRMDQGVLDMDRAVLHCDLNNFYASVECLYRPELAGLPVAVCGDIEQRHGIVLAKNLVAKRAGITTGEAIWQARQKCPKLVVVTPTFGLYLRFSRAVREIYSRYTPYIEAFGIDECWLDVTDNVRAGGDAEEIAHAIRNAVKEEIGITLSAGVSWNKVFAKLGSDLKKPDAVTVITKDNFREKVWSLPASELLYVGRATWRKFQNWNILTIGALANTPVEDLRGLLGKWGETLHMFANGWDAEPVNVMDYEDEVKGVGNSITTPRDVACEADARQVIYALSESVAERMRNKGLMGTVVQVWLRDVDLGSFTRQRVLKKPTCLAQDMAGNAIDLLRKNWFWEKPLRSLGVRMSGLYTEKDGRQVSLLIGREEKQEALERSIDEIRKRFGHASVKRAMMLQDPGLDPDTNAPDSANRVAFLR